ncbi:hypothetical protein V2J09_008482, partial [Rumex salicifolius]
LFNCRHKRRIRSASPPRPKPRVARRGRSSGFYVVDLEADKAWKTPIATALEFARDIGMVCLGSLVYYLGGPTVKGTVTWDQLRKEDHHLSRGTSYLSLAASRSYLHSSNQEKEEKEKNGMLMGTLLKQGPSILCGSMPLLCGPLVLPLVALAQPPKDLPLKHLCVSYPVFAVHFDNVGALHAYYPAAGNGSNGGGQWDCQALEACQRFGDCIAAYDVMTRSWLKVVYSVPFPHEVYMEKFENMLPRS